MSRHLPSPGIRAQAGFPAGSGSGRALVGVVQPALAVGVSDAVVDARPGPGVPAVDLEAVTGAIARRHPGVQRAVIEMEVADAASSFADATVLGYLAVLIEREVKLRLNLRRRPTAAVAPQPSQPAPAPAPTRWNPDDGSGTALDPAQPAW